MHRDVTLDRGVQSRARVTPWQQPGVQRIVAAFVVLYFSAVQFAVLPAALESASATTAPEQSSLSVRHLVDFLEGHGDVTDWSTAAVAAAAPVGVEGAATQAQLDAAIATAVAEWEAADPSVDLSGVTASLGDLPDLLLGATTGTAVTIDVDAAGHGWDVAYGDATDHMHLLTVVRHELGHVLGHAHGDGLMTPTLWPGEAHGVPAATTTSTESPTGTSTEEAGSTSTSTFAEEDGSPTTETAPADTGTDTTSAWVIDGSTATYTAGGALDHTLRIDGNSLALSDAAGTDDAIDLSGITDVAIVGTAGDDRLTLDLAADAPVAVRVDLGGGTDELVGPVTDQRWVIDGAGAGTVTGVAFVGVEHVTGATGNQDTFVIAATGSIAGVVAGGVGGFDVIELSGGDFDQVDFVATGPQSGTITRDGDVLTYVGMEPLTDNTSGGVRTITFDGTADTVTIQDVGTSDDGAFDVLVDGTAESVSITDAGSITELVINLAGGGDTFRLVSIDGLFTGLITLIGGDGSDTFEAPDVAARWDVTGIDAGTYQGLDGIGDDLGPAVAFSTIEHLVGALNEADSVNFDSGAGLTGTFIDHAGDLTVALAGFVKVTGDYDFVHDDTYTAQVVPAGGGGAADTSASVLSFGGTSGTGFIGTDPLDTPVGLEGELSSFGLAIVTTATHGYHVFAGTLDASFVGGDILSIPLTTMTISINDAGTDGSFLDLSGAAISAGPESLAFSSTVIQASVTTTLSIDAFVHVSGTFTFSRGGQYRVQIATGLPAVITGLAGDLVDAINELPRLGTGVDGDIDLVNDVHISNDFSTIYNLPVAVMTFSVVDAAIFVGYSPDWTDDGDGDIERAELGDDAIGFFANDINFSFAKLSPRPTEYRALNKKLPGFTAMKLSIGSIDFIGIDEITISASQLLVEVNNGKTWPGGLGPPVVDFTASFPGDPTDSDGDGEPDVPVGLLVGDLYLDYDGNQRFGISSPQVVLTLGDFVHIAGGFSFIKGPTTKVDIGTGLAAIVAEGLTALGDVAPDLKTAIESLVTSASEPGDGSLAIKDDFSMIWNVEVTTLQFGVSDVNIFIGYAPDGWIDDDGDHRIDMAEPGSGPEGAWVEADDDRDGDGHQDIDELGNAVGIYASDIDLGFVSMTPTLASLPGFDDLLPTFFALKATADNLSLVGIPEITLAALDAVLKVNSGTPWGKGKAWELPYTPRVDWAASFPDDPDGGGPATSGYLIETGGLPVVIDFGGSLLTEVSSDTVILTISDFVHISGGFSYRQGPGEVVEVATGLPAGLSQALLESLGTDNPLFQPVVSALTESGLVAATPAEDGSITVKDDFSTIWNVPVGTMQIGFSDVNVFIGYNPGWIDDDGDHRIDMAEPGSGPEGAWVEADDDRDGDGHQDIDELGSDAIGLYAFDIDVGIVFMTPSVTGFAIDEYLPSFYAVYASADNLALVGVPGITLSAIDVVINVNNGDAWPGDLGPPVVNFEATFGGREEAEGVDDDGDGLTGEPGGYQIDTGGDPIYINYDGNQRIGASSPEIILTLGDFVHLTGGFAFEMGPTEKVDIATGLPSDLLTLASEPVVGDLVSAVVDLFGSETVTQDPTDGTMAFSEDYAYLYNLEVATLQFGVSDVNVFIGFGLDWTDVDGDHRIDRAEPGSGPEGAWVEADDDRDGDGIQDVDEFGDGAVGLYAFDVDLGFALMTPTLKSLPGFDQFLPDFYALKASADELSLVGIDAITLAALGVRIEVNDGGNWGGTPWGGVIDWESSFDGDTDGDGVADGPVGFRVNTGRDPVYLDYPDQAILGGGADLVVIGISEFVHLRGSIYFEKGTVLSVPLVDGLLDTSVLNALVSELGLALDTDALDALNPVSGNKELEFLNIGGQDLYAFVGVGGPHWTTASGDLTDDLEFECDPGESCTDECDPDADVTDGHAAADDNDALCVLTLNENAIGLAVSDLDFALALGTPTNQLDPMRYITLRASVDEAGLVGLEDLVGGTGITATVRGVEFELNMSTPTLQGIPLLPVLDWKAYALDPDGGNCTTADLAALAAGGTAGPDCEPFGVKTGRLDENDDPVKVYFLYDSLLIRAAVEMLELDIMGVLVVRGSVAFVLGPIANVTLTDELATVVSGVTTMTLGGANIFGFIGVGGPHWLENGDGDVVYSVDTDGDGWGDGGPECDPPADPGTPTDCEVELNPSAIGLALTDLDFGLFVGTKISPTEPAAFIAADINLNNLSLVGVDGVTATGLLAIALNLGFALSASGASPQGIDFKQSFDYDTNGDGTKDGDGFALDTGNPSNPMILDFETSFVEVQLVGSIEIRAGPDPSDAAIARLDGIFYLAIDLEAGSEEFRLLALGEMTVGPDIGSSDPLLSIGALGVLVLNADGIAGDFTVNLTIGGPIASILDVSVYARVIFNTAGQDMAIELPDELYEYLDGLGAAAVQGVASPGPLAQDLLDRLEDCDPTDGLPDEPRCYVIEGSAPDLISPHPVTGEDAANRGTIDWLLGDGPKSGAAFEQDTSDTAYLVAVIDGSITVLGFASATVFGAIRIDGTEFELIADLTFQLGSNPAVSIMVEASVVAQLNADGLYLDAYVAIDANLLSVFDLDVTGRLTIDTTGATSFFQLSLSGSVSVLRVLSLSGSVTIVVGGPLGEDAWYFGASLSASFGPLGLSATGFVSSWGSFKLELTGYVDLTFAGTGIRGTLSAHVSYCLRDGLTNKTCLDDINAAGGDVNNLSPSTLAAIQGMQTSAGPLNDGGRSFLATLSGSVAVKFLGITLASVGVDLEVYGYLGQTVTVRATFRAKILFATVSKTVTIATFSLPAVLINGDPPPPLLGTMEGTTLKLNVGARGDERNVGYEADGETPQADEEYVITRLGERHYRVAAFGWTEDFTNVDHIEGDFGAGDDVLIIYDDVTATVYADMGANDDRVHAVGSGVATLYGRDGNDVLIGGSAADYLNGGDGADFLDGGGDVDTMIGGLGDDVFFGYGDELAGETLDPGSGYDSIEVIGRDDDEDILLRNTGSALHLTYDGGAAVDLTGMENLLLRLRGGDDLIIEGAVDAYGLEDLTIGFSPDTDQILATLADVDADPDDGVTTVGQELVAAVDSADTVTIRLLGTADDVTITGSQSAAPPTFAQGEGISAMFAEAGDPVPTTTIEWLGHIDFVLSNTELGATSHDYLILETLGGADDIAIKSLETDTVLRTGDGDDEVFVGSGASCTSGSCTSGPGTVGGINAPLVVEGGGNSDVLDVNDTADPDDSGGDTLLLTSTLIDGIDLHADGIGYSGIETLDIHLSGGNDAVRVRSTASIATTTIEGNDGLDIFDVSSDAPTNAGSLNGIAGDLVIDGGDGPDIATLSDAGDTTGNSGTLSSTMLTGFSAGDITYLDLATLHVDLGSAADNLTITGVHGGLTTVDAGAGADDIALQSAPLGSTVVLHGDAGDDDFEFGSLADASDGGTITRGGLLAAIDGAVTVDGDAPRESDTLHLDDTGNGLGGSGLVTRDTITLFGMAAGVTYLDVEHLTIALGDGVDDVDVTSTNGPGDDDADSETDTVLWLGGGDDRVDVSSTGNPEDDGHVNDIRGHLTINGEGHTDTVNVSDRADENGNTGELTSTDLTGLGMGTAGLVGHGITYAGLEYLNIDLGGGGDLFTVHSTHAGETTLDTRGGDDLVDVGADLGDRLINRIDGFLDIDTGDGTNDRLVVNAQNSAIETVGRITSTEITGLDTEIDTTLAPRDLTSDRIDVVTIIDGSHGTVALTWATSGQSGPVEFDLNADAATIRSAIATGLATTLESVLVSRTSLIRQDGTTFRITFAGLLAGAGGHSLGQLTVDIDCDPTDPADTGCVIGFTDTGGVVGKEVVTSTTGRIEYTNTEYLDVHLGTEAEYLELLQTGAVTMINSREGADVVDVEIVDHETTVVGGSGRDTIQVNVFPNTPDTNDINALLHLDGEQGEDTIFIQLSSELEENSFIEAFDSGTDEGVDDLVVQGSATNDQFLLRSYFVALLNNFVSDQYTHAEFVHYDEGIENLIINTLDGNDSVAFDDTNVATTVNLGDGEDFIQVGQLFGDECLGEPLDDFVPDQGPGSLQGELGCFDDDFVPPFLIDSTQGMLSNGISESTTVNGGAGNDLMIVFRNRAVLTLNGESGDDTFVIRTFLEEDSETQLDAGEGTDVISYIMNAPVNVNGGDGYDRLYIIGTEADDVFVITEDGVYGAGRFISFWGIELLGIDAVEGNDRIYVQSTDPAVTVEVYGGLGSDTIEIGSNLVPTIVEADGPEFYRPILAAADDLIGHSGLIVHTIDGNDVTIDGIAAEIVDDDEPAVLITQSGGITVVAEDDGSTGFAEYEIDTYTVVLTSSPTTRVLVEALTAILTPEQIDGEFGPAYNIQLSVDPTAAIDPDNAEWSTRGVVLYFDSLNWNTAQTVYVRAFDDNAPEGDALTAIRHTVGAYIEGEADGGTASTLDRSGAFSDGAGGYIDYAGHALVVEFPTENRVYTILENDADTLTIEGLFDEVPLGGYRYQIRGLGAFGEVVLNDLFVRVIDNDVDEVVVIESGADTTVTEHGGIVDSYQLGRTGDGDVALTVDLVIPTDGAGDPVVCVSRSQTDDTACLTSVDLLGGDLVTLWVHAIDDTVTEGFQYSTVTHTVEMLVENPDTGGMEWADVVVGTLLVGTIDDEHQTVQVVETDGSTVVTEGAFDVDGEPITAVTDTYTVFLSALLASGETLTLNAAAIETKTQYDAGDQIGVIDQCGSAVIPDGSDRITCNEIQLQLRYRPTGSIDPADWSVWAFSHDLTFTDANWATGFEVEVRAVDDDFIDGRILQAFPEAPARVNRIQGTLYVDGGPSAFGYPLDNFTPVMLPGESSSKLTITPNPAFDVIEDSAVDTLVLHNEDDVADSKLELTTANAIPNQPSAEFLAYLDELGATPEQPTADELENGVDRFALLGLGMGALGIQYDDLEVLDIWLGSGADDVKITTTHTGTTTIRGHEGDDAFRVIEIVGHTRILGGDGGDTITVRDMQDTLESLDAQLLVSGEEGDDTVIVDDSGDDRADETDDDRGTLTQTSLVGLDMIGTTPADMFSLELSGDVDALTVSIFAYRPEDEENDDPGVLIGERLDDGSGGWIEVPLTFTIDADAINALADLGALPYGDYSAYGGTGLGDTPATDLSGLDAYLLAGLIQHALFPHQEPTDPFDYDLNEDGTRAYTHANGETDDDRFPTTGCGRRGTTLERDSRCANSVYVWASGEQVDEFGVDLPGSTVRVYLIGFQGELAGLDISFEVVPEDAAGTPTGTYATDLQRTDGITYDTLETLDIRLGAGNDLFNVRGTLPHTLLDTGDGDDVVFVSDAAGLYAHTRPGMAGPEGLASALTGDTPAEDLEELHERTLHGTVVYDDRTYVGTLHEIDGDLDIDTGAGSNTLAVSDHASSVADGTVADPFVITSTSITGLATGGVTYTSTGGDLAGQGHWPRQADAGMFGRGITIHLGTGSDIGTIASVRGGTNADTPLQMTITTVYGNDGIDRLTVDAGDVAMARLVVYGDDGDDVIDGTDASLPLIVFGEDGNDDIQGGSGADVLFGDDGRVVLYRDTDSDDDGAVWDVWLGGAKVELPGSVIPGTSTVGAPIPVDERLPHDGVFETLDVLYTVFFDETGRDDIVRGGDGDDVVIGGVGDDGLDGEAGRDVVLGDRGILTRNLEIDFASPIVRALFGTTLVDIDPSGTTTLGAVGDTHQADPHGTWPWTITLLDHADGTDATLWGHDVAAGGAGEDVVFGQLGNDLLHGDGVLNEAGDGFIGVTDVDADDNPLVDTTTDGDDYVEGNGDDDTIFGGLGQDDLIGGSSDLFGLVTRDMRPDGIDTMFGGNGDAAERNDLGLGDGDLTEQPDALSRDADVILGDNGRIFRLVGTPGTVTTVGEFLTFTHDLGCPAGAGAVECIIPRQVELLDYTPVGERFLLAVDDPAAPVWHDPIGLANIGGGDFLHGEASNDTIWGATGQDAIFGDAGDDDLYGGTNRDWISGGAGSDGIVADHGIILTSRHGDFEPLYGVAPTTENANDQPELSTPGDLQTAHINQGGTLHKAVELDLVIDGVSYTTFFVGDHDIAYGGLGDDFLHGGEGDDMLSGAEALALYYTDDPWATLRSIYGAIVDHDAGVLQHGVVRERAGEFRCYDEFKPLLQVYVCDEDAQPLLIDLDGDGDEFEPALYLYLTNHDEDVDDGADVLFGDGGSDWIVGGVNHDRAFGGWGDDLLDMDDIKSTTDAPDVATWVTYADIAYGGAGRDVLIANTGADRLIDWVGEYNSYIVPFSPYGAFTISRSIAPHLIQYLYDLSAAEGADVTRGGDATRNGEPRGELGLVTHVDDAWRAQTGAPDDPQAGNTQGPRDVLRAEDFSTASSATTAFAVESGSWSVTNGRYESVASLSSDAISIFYVDAVLPYQYEIVAIVNADKDRAGYRSNAYIIFDYQSATDFKFAGLEMGTDKVEIGRRTASGWVVLASYNLRTSHNTNYHLRLWIDGQVVTLYVDGVPVLTHDYGSPLLVAGDPATALDPLTDGYVGIGSNGAVSRTEYFAVQVLAPAITFSVTDEFAVAPAHTTSGGTWTVGGGTWTAAPTTGEVALSLTRLTIAPSALLVLDTIVTTDGIAGVAFDVVSADRFKFAVLDTTTGRLLFGHYVSGAWVVEASFAVSLGAGTAHTLTVHLDGTTATAVVDGVVIGAHSWHNLLNDGGVGLLAAGGTASFDHLALSTDDPALEPALPFVNVADASVVEGDDGTTTLVVTVSLSRTTDRDVTVSWSTADGTAVAGSDFVAASGTVTILAGQLSATVTLTVTGDTTIEPDETLFLGLSSPDGAIIGDGTALLTIRNDDVDVVVDVVAVDGRAAEAGTDPAVFEITRTGATGGPLAVRLSWQGTAGFAVDYSVTVSGGTLSHDGTVLTIAAGISLATLTVTPRTDALAEPTETIHLHVLADQAYGVGAGSASADLADDAALPTLSISDAAVLEGDRGGTWVELTVTLSEPSASDVTVTYRTHEGTADAVDFRVGSGTVTFTAGMTVQTIRIRVYADRMVEPDEIFTVELTNPVNAAIADPIGVVTILDDEGGRLTATSEGSGAAPLDPAVLAAALRDAIAWWTEQGHEVAGLSPVTVTLVDLPGTTLAIQTISGLLLDIDAAGHGWGTRGMDLATVLRHELGHVMGLGHSDVEGHVMQALLAPGESWVALGAVAPETHSTPAQAAVAGSAPAWATSEDEPGSAAVGPGATGPRTAELPADAAQRAPVGATVLDGTALGSTALLPTALLPTAAPDTMLLALVAAALMVLGFAGSRRRVTAAGYDGSWT